MRNIILIAPPAAGKGTQAKLLEEKYNIPHISTGDLLRNEINSNSELSIEIKHLIENGLFVGDDIVLELVINRIKQDDCKNGYILDGFPRNLNQAKLYDDYLKSNNQQSEIAIQIKLDKEIAKARINNRITCSKCGRVYNLNDEKLKPHNTEICDFCGNVLSKRKDDNNDTYDIRYNKYVEDTEPILKYYQKHKNLFVVDGNKNVDLIFQDIVDTINKL